MMVEQMIGELAPAEFRQELLKVLLAGARGS
jgi:hypothetical protein